MIVTASLSVAGICIQRSDTYHLALSTPPDTSSSDPYGEEIYCSLLSSGLLDLSGNLDNRHPLLPSPLSPSGL